MFRSSVTTTLLAVPLLAGCGIFDANDPTAALTPVTQQASTLQPGAIYDPQYADGINTNSAAIVGKGISGSIANLDGTISQVNVRLSEDTSIAYVSIDGGPETEWSNKQASYANAGVWANGTDQLNVGWFGDSTASLYLSGTGYGQSGRIGLETPFDSLPTGSASYNGYWYAGNNSLNSNADGQIELDLDFATGGIDGLIAGAYNRYEAEVNELIVGTVDGTIAGSRIAGTAFIDTNDLSGELDFMGAIYGTDGTYAAGVLGGTLTSQAGDDPLHGDFYLTKDGHIRSGF